MSCWSLVLCSYIQQYGQEHLEWILLLVQDSWTFYTRRPTCVLGFPGPTCVFEVKTIDGDADIKSSCRRNHPGKFTFLNPENGGLKKMIFLSNWVMFRWSMLIFWAVVDHENCNTRNFWVETQWDWLGTNDFFSVNWICNLMTNHDEPNQNISPKKHWTMNRPLPTHQYTRVKIDGTVTMYWFKISQLLTYLLGTVSHVLWP